MMICLDLAMEGWTELVFQRSIQVGDMTGGLRYD